MYLDYWGLKKPPFGNVPSQSLFYRSPQHEEAFNRLLYVIQNRQGVAMLTGEVGCGKTTVTKALMEHLDRDKYQFQLLSNPALSPLDLIRSILLDFNEKSVNGVKPVLLARLKERLLQNAKQEVNTVLAIDEAHVIGNQSTLDEIRMLLNMQEEEQFLITIILLGQPPLLKTISSLQPLKERISVKYHLESLDPDDTMRYIVHRLKQVGAERGFFTSEAVPLVYEYSGGIPLRINNLCDRCLLIGFMRKSRIINTRIVTDAVEDLQ